MESVINAQLERTFREFQVLGEVKNCVQDLITQLELKEKDAVMFVMVRRFLRTREGLTKQLKQLRKENQILEESNSRYSKLQLIEAQVVSVRVPSRIGVLPTATRIPKGIERHPDRAKTDGEVCILVADHFQFGSQAEGEQWKDRRNEPASEARSRHRHRSGKANRYPQETGPHRPLCLYEVVRCASDSCTVSFVPL